MKGNRRGRYYSIMSVLLCCMLICTSMPVSARAGDITTSHQGQANAAEESDLPDSVEVLGQKHSEMTGDMQESSNAEDPDYATQASNEDSDEDDSKGTETKESRLKDKMSISDGAAESQEAAMGASEATEASESAEAEDSSENKGAVSGTNAENVKASTGTTEAARAENRGDASVFPEQKDANASELAESQSGTESAALNSNERGTASSGQSLTQTQTAELNVWSTKEMPELNAAVTTANHIKVTVHADEGTFPAGTRVKVIPVSKHKVLKAAGELLNESVVDAAAVDISFIDKDGEEIEPEGDQNVMVSMDLGSEVDGGSHELIHIEDDGSAQTVDSVNKLTNEHAEFSADSFSIYAIVGIVDKNRNMETYEFYVPKDGNQEGELVSSQTVKEGDTLSQPKVPETFAGKTFAGWVDAEGNAFDGFGIIGNIDEDGRTIKVYAEYKNAIYLYYYDQYDNLIDSQPVEPDSTVTIVRDYPMIQVQPLTECQDGWSRVKGGKEDASGSFEVGTESVKLYPILKEGYWVNFESGSDTSFEKQFIARNAKGNDKKVQKPEAPVKQGYVFDQWYEDEERTKPYDFTQDVKNPMTLYAGYKPAADTEYKVQYWIEYQKEPGTGVGDGIWEYKFLADDVKTGTTGQKAEFDPNLIYKSPYNKKKEQYELNEEKTIAPEIKADGSTVCNVYYQCKSYKLSIAIPLADGKNTTLLSYDNVKYSSDLTNFWKAVFQVRPESELFNDTDGFVFKYLDNRNFVVYHTSDLGEMGYYNIALHYQKHEEFNRYLLFYLEGLHGKAPDGEKLVSNTSRRGNADDRTYYLKKQYVFRSNYRAWLNISLGYFKGFTPMMEVSDGHFIYQKDGSAMVYYAYPEEEFKKDYPGLDYHVVYNADGTQHMYIGANDPIKIYYKRNTYKLIFNTEGGPKLDTQSVLYEDDLSQYNPSAYKIGETTKKISNEEFVFAGWYTDADLSTSFDFADHVTMPAYDIELYAKWVPETYTVTFDTGKGTKVDKVTDIEYSHIVDRPDDPSYTGHVFLGWTLDGKPYSFESGVTKDLVLKAEWRSIDAWPVTYDLNGGSGTVSEDDKKYYEDAGVTVADQKGITAPDGKVFLGWKSGMDGRLYYPNASLPMAFGGMTLTAQWGDAERTAPLTYDFNFDHFGIHTDGATSSTVSAVKNNSTLQLADISELREIPAGYEFKGWYLDKDCTKGPYDMVMVDNHASENNHLYAKWVKKPAGGGSSSSGGGGAAGAHAVQTITGTDNASVLSAVLSAPDQMNTADHKQHNAAAQDKISANASQPENATNPDKDKKDSKEAVIDRSVKTGDHAYMMLYFMTMLGCTALLLLHLFKIKRRKE